MGKLKIGARLRELREKLEITQKQVEKDIGILQKALSGYERNKVTPPIETIVKLAKYYGVTVDYLLLGERKIENELKKERDFGFIKYLEEIESLEEYDQRKAVEIMIKNTLVANKKNI